MGHGHLTRTDRAAAVLLPCIHSNTYSGLLPVMAAEVHGVVDGWCLVLHSTCAATIAEADAGRAAAPVLLLAASAGTQ
jgi:hypothetical protein